MLIGEKIYLRPLILKDLEKTILLRNNQKIKNLTLMHPFPVTYELEKEWFNNILNSSKNETLFFGIVENKTQEFIGFTSLNNINWINGTAYFTIVIDEKYQNNGYGKEALHLIRDYAFKNIHLRKILLQVADCNSVAVNLYKKEGFVEEGKLKEHVFINDKFEDIIIMSLFKKRINS